MSSTEHIETLDIQIALMSPFRSNFSLATRVFPVVFSVFVTVSLRDPFPKPRAVFSTDLLGEGFAVFPPCADPRGKQRGKQQIPRHARPTQKPRSPIYSSACVNVSLGE